MCPQSVRKQDHSLYVVLDAVGQNGRSFFRQSHGNGEVNLAGHVTEPAVSLGFRCRGRAGLNDERRTLESTVKKCGDRVRYGRSRKACVNEGNGSWTEDAIERCRVFERYALRFV